MLLNAEDRFTERVPASSTVAVNKMLASLPVDDRQRLSAHLTLAPMRFREILYKQNQRIDYVYFPGSGACSLTRCMENGQVAEIATIGNEGIVGASVFFGDDRSFSEVIVQVGEGAGFRMPVVRAGNGSPWRLLQPCNPILSGASEPDHADNGLQRLAYG